MFKVIKKKPTALNLVAIDNAITEWFKVQMDLYGGEIRYAGPVTNGEPGYSYFSAVINGVLCSAVAKMENGAYLIFSADVDKNITPKGDSIHFTECAVIVSSKHEPDETGAGFESPIIDMLYDSLISSPPSEPALDFYDEYQYYYNVEGFYEVIGKKV